MEAIRRQLFPKEYELRDKGLCPFCGKVVYQEDFREARDVEEWSISGLCQACIDKTFKER